MAKRLKDSVSSAWMEAANRLNSKKARRRIVAYVESYDDVFFWRTVLSRYENSERFFEVLLPTRDQRLERGKKAVLMNMVAGRVGKDMIACVDADYDFLMQGGTAASQSVVANPYVFHTYAYSIENLQCYAPSLHDVCVAVTLNDHALFDFEEYMRQFSLAIFPLFVWSIWSYRTANYNEFSITDFLHIIETGHFSMERADSMLQNLRRKVGRKINDLQKRHPEAKESYMAVKEDVKRLGVSPETTYLYIQGHYLFDKVITPMLKKVCTQLVKERETEICRQSVHGVQRRNELSCYSHSLGDIVFSLKKNTGCVQSEPFRRILQDVERFLSGGQQPEQQQNSDGTG